MRVLINARGLTIDSAYREALARRLQALARPLPAAVEAKVVLSREKHRRTAAITLVARHHALRAAETAPELVAAVDLAVDALRRQVREVKDRVKNRKGRGERVPPRVPVAGGAGGPEVVVRRVPLKPMALAEAAEELRVGRDDFVVFVDARTEGVHVLYRRPDGGLGLIEPVA